MNQITQSLSELSLTTTPFFNKLFGSTAATSSNPVKITRAEPIKKAKSLPLDQFIASLCADDPRLDAAISEGSRWVAQSFYAEAPASIRKRRLETGMTQTQLAIAMDTSQSYIAKLERGEINAGMDVIGRLAKALSMKPEDAFILLFAEYEKKHD